MRIKKTVRTLFFSLIVFSFMYGIYIQYLKNTKEKIYTIGKVVGENPYTRGGGSVEYEFFYEGKNRFGSNAHPHPSVNADFLREGQYWKIELVGSWLGMSKMLFDTGPCDSLGYGQTWNNLKDVPCISDAFGR